MFRRIAIGFVWGFTFFTASAAELETPPRVASVESAELAGFDTYSPKMQLLVEACLALTKQNLGYKFGSGNPAAGGMDCSGTIYYVLQSLGLSEVPRSASGQYVWARKAGTFQAVVSRKMTSFELDALRPGDLLFWCGTYSTANDPPVTHTMIYLGKRRSDATPLMFGASEGRTYQNQKMSGVSVFDFKLPAAPSGSSTNQSANSRSQFIGYARIPEFNSISAPSP